MDATTEDNKQHNVREYLDMLLNGEQFEFTVSFGNVWVPATYESPDGTKLHGFVRYNSDGTYTFRSHLQ